MSAPTFVGLLSDEERLKIVGAIALGARTAEQVAAATGVDPAEVRAALPRLVSAGILEHDEALRIRFDALRAAARERPPRERELPGATPEQAAVLRNFVEGGRLVAFPVKASQRRVVLDYLTARFEPGVEYSERQVNGILLAFHDDCASARRHLVDEGLLERSAGVYRRPA